MLTEDEQKAITMAAELWNQLCKVVGQGDTRENDLRELVIHIHAIQQAVMSNEAGRSHPGRYRLLGGEL